MKLRKSILGLALGLALGLPTAALSAFHLWEINEIWQDPGGPITEQKAVSSGLSGSPIGSARKSW